MIRPQPSRLRMKRRKTVSVTPAMGASTVAGEIRTSPMERLAETVRGGAGWRTRVSAPQPVEWSQNLRMFGPMLESLYREYVCQGSDQCLRRALVEPESVQVPP